MKSLSSVGLGLSIVFGSLLLALVAELYYLVWWKKRLSSKRDFFYMFCLKTSSALNPQEIRITTDEPQQQQQQESHQFGFLQSKLKPFDEVMRPPPRPRVLFTIVEETKEDLDQFEEAKSNSKAKFGSMLVETPYFTPVASPPLNPLLESASEAEFNKIRLKLLKEEEEKKLHKRILMAERVDDDVINGGFDDGESGDMTPPSKYLKEEEDESFITINVDMSKERGFINQHQFHSTYASQVLPLSSSPSTFRSPRI
ncbi:hypothetical protein HRI_002156700 [Hibiscus trionum]|uniref:Uncharacterized protein n=1 Tax=Hibiscus trionum TaxID=183268 RepID=A0A9W7M1R6_HIBTR|nr:hypothetical protein HRI_002156700 [Hibiscus trionum]